MLKLIIETLIMNISKIKIKYAEYANQAVSIGGSGIVGFNSQFMWNKYDEMKWN